MQLALPDRHAVQLAGDHAKAVVAAPVHAVLQVALRDLANVASYLANGPQHEKDGSCGDHRRNRDNQPRQLELTRRRQRVVRNRRQPNHKANKQHTAENQSLSKIEHDPVSAPEKRNLPILADTASRRKGQGVGHSQLFPDS